MTVSQADKAKKFRALHEAPGAFIIANPWDAGSARMLAGLGFPALATSSGAKAGVLGKRDGKVTREEALANARLIASAVDLPVIGDPVYGVPDQTLGRQFLHAGRLAFDHPFTDARIDVESPLPPELDAYLGRLRGSG